MLVEAFVVVLFGSLIFSSRVYVFWPHRAALYTLHVHLFKAAATYALFVRSGERDQDLRERTNAEIGLCKQIDSAFQPDRRVFTPRFISVFTTGTVAGGTEATPAGPRQ